LDTARSSYGTPKTEPIRLRFSRSTIDPWSVLVDEELDLRGFDEIYDWAKRKINFIVIDADTGEDITAFSWRRTGVRTAAPAASAQSILASWIVKCYNS